MNELIFEVFSEHWLGITAELNNRFGVCKNHERYDSAAPHLLSWRQLNSQLKLQLNAQLNAQCNAQLNA